MFNFIVGIIVIFIVGIICIIVGAGRIVMKVHRIFIVDRFNGITIGIGVLDSTISFAGVGMNFDEGGRSGVKGDARLAVKIQICGAGRRIYVVMLGMVIELVVGGRGVGWGVGRANSGIITAVAVIDGTGVVVTVTAHR